MNSRTSIEQECGYRDCKNLYRRYDYQIKRGTGSYCSQSCASKESAAVRYKDHVPTNKQCSYCGLHKCVRQSRYCRICYNIRYATSKYGLKIEDYYDLLNKQDNKCAICKKIECPTGRNFAIDHDHETGKIRGLLCLNCNANLGWLENQKDSVDDYLVTNMAP